MSDKTKKQADWTDFIAGGSSLPADEMTFTDASTYGLQGFQFDTNLGEGVLDGPARLPETKGMSGLPDGLVRSVEEDLDVRVLTEKDEGSDLSFMLSEDEGGLPITATEKTAASLVDLAWLDPTQEQDPERLPENPLDVKPEAESQWSAHRRMDVFGLIPNRDREIAEYEQSIREGPRSQLPGQRVGADVMRNALLRAIRRSHYGVPVLDIKKELVATLGMEAKRLQAAVQVIEDDHGLAGNVFIRASAFPGLRNGKWADEIKKVARTARYVITEDEAVATRLGMQMVGEVPWDEALDHYRPLLSAAGYKVASKGNPKEILRRAFTLGPLVPVVQPSPKPQGQILSTPKGPDPSIPIKTSEERARESKIRVALVRIAQWVKGGRLSQEDAIRLHRFSQNSAFGGMDILKAATDLMTAAKGTPIYGGVGAQLPKDAAHARQQVWASLAEKQAVVEGDLTRKAKIRLAKAVKAGSLTSAEAQKIVTLAKSAAEMESLTAAAIQAAPALRQPEMKPVEAKEYAGSPQEAAPIQIPKRAVLDDETQRILRVAQASGFRAGEILGLLRWARCQMSEGLAGDNLDTLLGARFSGPLLKAASGLLAEARKAHEGLSGHVYVDAGAYASPAGFTGCDKGALRHRANSLKFVLAMSRCASCTSAVGGVCQKYNKRLADGVPVEDPETYQKEAIRLANAPDPEVTASLFNPGEFSLHNDALDEVSVSQSPQAQVLSDVLFGGIELE